MTAVTLCLKNGQPIHALRNYDDTDTESDIKFVQNPVGSG